MSSLVREHPVSSEKLFCRECSQDSSYVLVHGQHSPLDLSADLGSLRVVSRKVLRSQPRREQQASSNMVWTSYDPDSASEQGDMVASAVAAHQEYVLRKSSVTGSVTLLSYCTDSNFNTAKISIFGAKVSVGGKQTWYMGFKSNPTGHVQVIHVSTTPFVLQNLR